MNETTTPEVDRQALAVALDALDRARIEIAQLQHALDSRVAIEQAKGYLAAVADIDIDSAFHALRKFSRSRNLKLRQVSLDFVAGTLIGEADLLRLARGESAA